MSNNKLKKNLAYNIIYQILIVFLPLITSPYLSRTLGAEISGVYSYNFSIAHYFMIFAMLGISTYGNRLIASIRDDREKLNRSFWSLFYFHILISLFVFVLYLIYSLFILTTDRIIGIILGLYVLSATFDITWFFFGIEEFKTIVIRNCIVKFLNFICILIFVKSHNDLWKYTLIMSIGYLISQMIVWKFIFKHISYTKVTWDEIKEHIKPNIILFLPVIATSIFTYMDKIMLGTLASKIEVGYYDYSEKIIDIPKSIIRAMGAVMLPTTTNMMINGKREENKRFLEGTLFYVLFMAIPVLFGLASISSVFAPLYFGEEYSVSGTLIALLCPALLFSVWGNVIRTQYLIPSHRDKEYVSSLFAGALVNLVLNLIFIPLFGSIGAVIGTIGAEFILCTIQTWFARDYFRVWKTIKSVFPFIPGGVVMFITVCFLKCFLSISFLSLFIEVIVGIIIYVIVTVPIVWKSKNRNIKILKERIIRYKNISNLKVIDIKNK